MNVDRELAELLAVNPSPEFVASVRQRIAFEPSLRRRVRTPALVAAAVLAWVVAIAVGRGGRETAVVFSTKSQDDTAILTNPNVGSGAGASALAPVSRLTAAAPTKRERAVERSEFVPVPAMTYREIEPQRGERPVAEMEVHAVPPIEAAGGEAPWSTL